jgi:hypothetical protein
MSLTHERIWQEFKKSPEKWPLHPEAGPFCDCCLHFVRAGDARPRRIPAAYVWTLPTGHEVPLCVSCCAHWRANADVDRSLSPLRIRSATAALVEA